MSIEIVKKRKKESQIQTTVSTPTQTKNGVIWEEERCFICF